VSWCEILLTEKPLDAAAAVQFVSEPGCGAINVFIGTVRDTTQKKQVTKLEFEAYKPMAIKEMKKIADKAKERWPVKKMVIHHRVGALAIGAIPVVIAVSSPHRKIAFEACQFAIDTLKETVPIWKKEYFNDGAVWVAAHP